VAAAGVLYALWKYSDGGTGAPLAFMRDALKAGIGSPTKELFSDTITSWEAQQGMPFLQSPLATFLASSTHYLTTAAEEVAKWLYPPAGLLIAAIEAFPMYQAGVPVLELVKMRALPTLLHVGTSIAYVCWGWRAFAVTLPLHWAHNWAVGYAWSAGYIGQAALASIATTSSRAVLEAWRADWSRGLDSDIVGLCDASSAVWRMRAFAPIHDFQDKLEDWRQFTFRVVHCGVTYKPYEWSVDEAEAIMDRLGSGDCHCDNAPVLGEECRSCELAPATHWSYPLLITSGHLYQPSKDTASTVACAAARDYVDKFGFYRTPALELLVMDTIRTELHGAEGWLREAVEKRLHLLPLATKEECIAALGGYKGMAFGEAWKRTELYGTTHRTKLQVKYNETLKAAGLHRRTGRVVVKPRSVKNVDTEEQTHILVVSRMLAKYLKCIFDGSEVFDINGFRVRIIIAHATKENLDAYAGLLSGDELTILVSCDDTVVSFGAYAAQFGCACQETDYASYDQSQSLPFWEADTVILEPIYRDEEWWRLHFDINAAAVSCKIKPSAATGETGRDFDEISAKLRTCMRTGVGTTSDLGSLHNLQAHVAWLLTTAPGKPVIPFERFAALLGLETKIQRSQSLDGVTSSRGSSGVGHGTSSFRVSSR